jgi:hypothetical protein
MNLELQRVSIDVHENFIKYITVTILTWVTDLHEPNLQDTENTEADRKCDYRFPFVLNFVKKSVH